MTRMSITRILMLSLLPATLFLYDRPQALVASSALQPSATVIDPPAIDEAAVVTRLVSMTQPTRGERAIIVFDPTYYPGITNGLRDELNRRGVDTYVLVEDSQEMIRSYIEDDAAHDLSLIHI